MRKLLCFCLLTSLVISLSSCATLRKPPIQQPLQQPPRLEKPICSVVGNNIIHIVSPGETLWHISKTYGIPMADIMQANNLSNAAQLEKGQRLVIPNAATAKAVIPLYLSKKWTYIIIHHSATDTGDAYYLNILHRRRGWDGIGYDFVIDNGTKGKQDGAIEVSPRWINQEIGAHCHASDMNYRGIGICLVGNFSKEQVSQKQMASLVYLTNVLRQYYGIPMDHILGHGRVPGARTECPGKYFPLQEFRKRLESCR